MKRLLSWLVIVLCFIAVCILATLDYRLAAWMFDAFEDLSTISKILLVIFGGSFVAGLALAPAYYGAILTMSFSDKVQYSEKGIRYIIFGAIIAAIYGFSMMLAFNFRDMLIVGYGVLLVIFGIMRTNGSK